MSASIPGHRIVVIGAGNLATHLVRRLSSINKTPVQIYSHTLDSATLLGNQFEIPFTNEVSSIDRDADVYLISISDDQIGSLNDFQVGDKIVAHTSGTVSMDVLARYTLNYGVFYPLQTFKKEVPVDFPNIPILIEGANEGTKEVLMHLADLVGKRAVYMTDSQRKIIHLSAVIANNFTNHLWLIAQRLLEEQQIDFKILLPLISKSVSQLQSDLPAAMQTGPAKRGDQKTIDQHLQLLEQHPDWKHIYEILTIGIQKENDPTF